MYLHIGSPDQYDIMKNYDPQDLWISTPDDQFPDPKLDVDGFIRYCGDSYGRLTAYLWLVTREMIESGVEIKPIAMHEPYIFSKLLISLSVCGISDNFALDSTQYYLKPPRPPMVSRTTTPPQMMARPLVT